MILHFTMTALHPCGFRMALQHVSFAAKHGRAVRRADRLEQPHETPLLKEPNIEMNCLTKLSALAMISVVAACSPRIEPQPIRGEPILNKYGSVGECVAPDGRTYSASADPLEPCLPPPSETCPGGFVSVTGEYICPDGRGDDPDLGPFGTSADPTSTGTPQTPPSTGPGGFATIGGGSAG